MVRTSCGMANIVLHFEASDVVIQPFQLDIYKNEGQFDHARTRVSREAGDLIDQKVDAREPVSIYSENTRISRLIVPDEGVDISRDEAFLRLFDELQIAQYRTIDKTFSDTWKLDEIIDYIFNEIKEEDEYDVLTHWEDSEVNVSDYLADTVAGSTDIPLIRRTPVADVLESIVRFGMNRYDFLRDDADFEFEDINALEALHKIAEFYGFDIFTKNDGVMYIGSQHDDVSLFDASFEQTDYNLTNYTVPLGQNKIKGVLMEGGYVYDLSGPQEPSLVGNWELFNGDNRYQMYGAAIRNDIEEGSIVKIPTSETRPELLQDIAFYHLENEVELDKSGNCNVDLLSSDIDEVLEDNDDIRTSSIEDMLRVSAHEGICQDIIPGLYYIDSIHHEINPQMGWMVNLGIKRILTGNIGTGAFGYSHQTNTVEEDFNMLNLGLRYDDGTGNRFGVPGYMLEPVTGDLGGEVGQGLADQGAL